MDASGGSKMANYSRNNNHSSELSKTPEDQQQLCLKWADYQSNLTNVFDSLLQQEAFVDVTISTEAGKSLKCHKVVLSACSAYFQNLFVENPCQHPIVILRDVEWRELCHIIEYMYKGQIHVGPGDLSPLLRSAESLQIRGLVDLIRPLEEGIDSSRIGVKRRRLSNSASSKSPSSSRPFTSPKNHCSVSSGSTNLNNNNEPISSPPISPQHSSLLRDSAAVAAVPLSSPNEEQGSSFGRSGASGANAEDMVDVKPGIMEMIQEEQRAKMLEASQLTHNWMAAAAAAAAASTSTSPQDNNNVSYQYQLQSMWQKCWNTNTAAAAANMLQQAGVRYRERGPMKSWRPETMAEAIWSVLQEGLSLSQAARKHDIPYPTFVLYANRVHNMLGPSRNGGSPALGELRPKGRGRPQRILLGNWPESHVRQVIRAVVFREGGLSNISEDSFLLPPRSGEEELHSGASSSGIRPPSTHSERGEYSPPRKVTHTPPPTTPSSTSTSETLHNQLKSLYGQHSSSPKSLMAAVAAMGGPLSELIMKEIDFDPLMLKTLMRLQGNGVYDDADEAGSKRGDDGGKPSSSKSLPSLTLNPEVILTEISEGSKEAYDNLRPPRDLIAAGSTDS